MLNLFVQLSLHESASRCCSTCISCSIIVIKGGFSALESWSGSHIDVFLFQSLLLSTTTWDLIMVALNTILFGLSFLLEF
jgi:hypothetical protein